jgi:hypothetical protein
MSKAATSDGLVSKHMASPLTQQKKAIAPIVSLLVFIMMRFLIDWYLAATSPDFDVRVFM